ncbi:hypothetical protein [Aurantimonas sp. A3-2-R12]|uniref:hypothetical protein n=1 Tax=Aurantimonas sp. A3-2-R12 TaxID=3114362 RepID=UPI002E18589C|nr:hypothetical protein [Aurantimonas sp. A3-2-R12]
MEILAIRPEPPGAATKRLAHFDAQLTPDIRIFGLKLVQTPSGPRVYPPRGGANACATFSPAFAIELTSAAMAALDGENRGIIEDS